MKYKKYIVAMFMLAAVPFAVTAPVQAAKCAGVDTSIIQCDTKKGSDDIEDNGVWQLLLIAIRILTAGVGVVAVGGFVYAAILYASAEDKADQVKEAKGIMTNVVIGLILFALMYSLLEFLIPGGIFS